MPLPRSFFARPAPLVARELVGQLLWHGEVLVRISEVEAYCGPADSACHARHGRTARNAALWGPPGHVYMYRCYGLHMMLNVVTGPLDDGDGRGQAILIRSGEVVRGLDVVLDRRGSRAPTPSLLAGPGKLAQGLGLDLGFNHHDVCARGGLEVRAPDDALAAHGVLVGARIGVDFARPRDRKAPLRFALADTRAVTAPGGLRRRLDVVTRRSA